MFDISLVNITLSFSSSKREKNLAASRQFFQIGHMSEKWRLIYRRIDFINNFVKNNKYYTPNLNKSGGLVYKNNGLGAWGAETIIKIRVWGPDTPKRL